MSTADRLRNDIDSGRTGDKVAASDPAAAPLGTDEEAAGTPPSREAVELARRHEVVRADPPHERVASGSVVLYSALIVVMAALLVGAGLYLRGAQ